jgi:undecaprenyl-phosphate 4-deoxy-4-formamido-L-arabinose transferase
VADGPALSVVVPVLDEGATIRELVERLAAALRAQSERFEIVVVDDGSSADHLAATRTAVDGCAEARLIELSRHFGQVPALVGGLREAAGAVVVTMDGDLQDRPEDVPRLVGALDAGALVAAGCTQRRHRSVWRRAGSRAVQWLARRLTGVRLSDFGGQFNAYQRPAVDGLLAWWRPGTPLLPLACWLGYPVVEVEVGNDPRVAGRSRYRTATLLAIAAELLTAFSLAPLLVLMVVSALAFGVGVVSTVVVLVTDQADGVAGTAALVLTGTGAVLCGVSAVGLYVARLLTISSTRPGYVVRDWTEG